MAKTIQQQRADFALTHIQSWSKTPETDLLTCIRGLPAMIQTNGLGQAMAFYYAKKKTHRKVYKLVADWLMEEGKPYAKAAVQHSAHYTSQNRGEANDQLLVCIVKSDQRTYQLAQLETQAFLVWVVRFAQAFIEPPKKKESEGEDNDSK